MKISPITSYNYSIKKTSSQTTSSQKLNSNNFFHNSTKPSFGSYLIDDMFYYLRGQKNGEREEFRKDQIEQIWTKTTSDVSMVSDRLGITFRDAKEMYQEYLELGGIKANRNGNESGLNKVVGYSLEKLDLIKEVVAPIVLLLKNNDEKEDVQKYREAIPSGVVLFGPHGFGKDFLTECFYEHLQTVAKQKDVKLVTVDMDEPVNPDDEDGMIQYIRNTFENAECWDGKKHTVIFIRNLDDYLDKASDNVVTELAFEMTGAKDKGITWIAKSDKGADLPDWIFSPSRLGVAKSIRDINAREMSTVMSYFWAKFGRFDKSKHEEIMKYCKTNSVVLTPPMFAEVADLVNDKLSESDRTYANEPDYIAPVTTEEVLYGIKEYEAKKNKEAEESGKERELPKSKYTRSDEERLVGTKIGRNMALLGL